jgi:hypothetical protein
MRQLLRKRFACLLVCLLAVSLSAALRAESYVHQPTGLVFPDHLGPAERIEIIDYETEQPGLGAAARYRFGGFRFDVFVYDALEGRDGGITEAAFARQFSHCVGDIARKSAEGDSPEPQPRFLRRDTYLNVDDDRPGLVAGFELVEDGVPKRSFLHLTVRQKHYVKIRATYEFTPENLGAHQEIMRQLSVVLGK